MKPWAIKKEEVLSSLQTNTEGLSEEEAEIRLVRYGKNVIKDIYKINPFKIFLSQINSFLIYILIFAVIISFIIHEYIDAGVIIAIILLNAGLGFFQQYGAEKSILELRKILVPIVRVMRKGKLTEISSEMLVPGDIVNFKEGDKVVADCRILNVTCLEVNEAILTGESFPVEKQDTTLTENAILAERENMLYTGTTIVKGSAIAVVTATGMETEFGKIASSVQDIRIGKTPMQRKLDKFAKQIGLVVLVLCGITALIGIIAGLDKMQMLLTAIALAVSAIPEGLPAVITIGLAFAARKMLKHNVIVRKLPAAETLGSVAVICTDKTGTLTEERMIVREMFCNNLFYTKADDKVLKQGKAINIQEEKELRQLVKISLLCNNARFEKSEHANGKLVKSYDIIGDPTESALVMSALDLNLDKKALSETELRVKEISFTSERKMMSIIRKGERRLVMYSKGSPYTILTRCAFELRNGKIEKLSERRKKMILHEAENMENRALRVLAFAFRVLASRDEREEGLIFSGFICMLDPPRKEVRESILKCINAGINVKMITGDSARTALAIAKEIGIKGKMIAGYDLDNITDKQLTREIAEINIFARISPEQKLRIIQILKFKGENIAVTGDGVNDVLALKKADIGIAMGIRGSDVAREVSEMVLLDDNFSSVVNAVEEGRTTYDNIKKITKYLLAVSFSELLLIISSIIFLLPLPLLPIHILWMSFVTDSIPALSLIKEKGEDVMNKKPSKDKSILDGILAFVIIVSLVTFLAQIAIFLVALKLGYDIDKVRSIVVTSDTLFELFFVFTCRSNKKLSEIGLFSNKWVWYTFLFAFFLQLIALYTPLGIFLSLVPLSFKDWLLVLPFAASGLIIFEIAKLFRKK